jgi:hypothetical protein
MIKDVFVLKKNSWHTKLMKRIWGWNYYDFSNMCPYFWLTVLNCLIAPFIILFDVVKLIATKIADFVMPYLDAMAEAYEKRCEEKREKWYDSYLDKIDNILFKENPTESDYKLLHKIKNADYSKDKHLYTIYREKLDYEKREILRNRYYELEAEFYRKKREEDDRKYEMKIAKEKTNRQKIAAALPVVKMIVKGIGIVALIFATYLLYRLALVVISWDWLNILKNVGKYTLGLLLIGVAIAIIWFIGKILIKLLVKLWCVFANYCIPCEERADKLEAGLRSIGSAFAYPFVKTGQGIVFVWELLVTLKKNNCPGIDWED